MARGRCIMAGRTGLCERRTVRVTYDVPPEVVSAVEGRAGALGVDVSEYVTARLVEGVVPKTVAMRIGAMVRDGKTDAYIAGVLSYTPGRVATIRRSLGLSPNKNRR